MKHPLILSVATMALLSVAACSSQPTTLPPGKYKTSEKSVNQHGTATKKETTTDVYYDKHGNKRAVQETETSRDPKGLFNKTETQTTRTYD